MGRTSTRLSSFYLYWFMTRGRVRSISKPISAIQEEKISCNGAKQGALLSRRIMVLVESSREAKAALYWALSHTIQSHDTIVLLDVVKPSSKHGDESERERNPKSYELLYAMKKLCQAKKPEVELSPVEGKKRGPTIVEEAKRQGISLMVLGQEKLSMKRRLLIMWANSRISGGGVVDYWIKNATCLTPAVKKKSRRGDVYLITTRWHKDFWLLA